MTHLWEMKTYWFYKNKHENVDSTFPYRSWKDFMDCKPYKIWKPYILSSWCWKTVSAKEYETQRRFETEKPVMERGYTLRVNHFPYDKPPSFQGATDSSDVDMLQIVFLSPDRFTGVHRVEIKIQREDEEAVKNWLKRHIPHFWKLD
jgi:hypothetical protein